MTIQEPQTEGNWLYNNRWDEQTVFSQKVYLPSEDTPKWAECTQERKKEWKDEYQPEPPKPEPETEPQTEA